MATVRFGNVSADMRLEDAGYGMPEVQAFDDFVLGFEAVREVELENSATRIRVQQFDSLNRSMIVTAQGNMLTGQVSYLAIEAGSITQSVDGALQIDPFGNASGTISATHIRKSVGGTPQLLAEITGISVDYNQLEFTSDASVLAGADSVVAGSGNDYLLGYAGNDSIDGGLGNDTLDGGFGVDRLTGGGGDDSYLQDNASDSVVESAGGGTDTVNAALSIAALPDNVEHLALLAGAVDGSGNALANRVLGNLAANRLDGLAGDDTLEGNGGDDTLAGGSGADSMAGGAGNDVFVIDAAGDVVVEAAGGGSDRIESAIDITLAANVEDLVLTGEAALDGTGNTLANLIHGNAGANVLDGGGGADTLYGHGGNDTYRIGGSGSARLVEYAGDGLDTVLSAQDFALPSNIENLVLTGLANASGTGNTGDNALTGNDQANRLAGLAGNDTLRGSDGDDTVQGGAGRDYLYGGTGRDLADYGAAGGGVHVDLAITGRQLTGGAGTDNLYAIEDLAGSNFADTLAGNAEGNDLRGGGRNDWLAGVAGDDTLQGEAGDDTLAGGGGDDLLLGGTGSDRASYADATAPVTVALVAAAQDTGGAGIDTLAGIENLLGSDFDDRFDGNGLANALAGGGANDTLAGAGGNDTLLGDAGNDRLLGATGADRLLGGAGADTLAGGEGRDTFVFGALAEAGDLVRDFTPGAGGDVLELHPLLATLGYAGSDPLADGYIALLKVGRTLEVRLDADGGGDDFGVLVLTLAGVAPVDMDLAANLLF